MTKVQVALLAFALAVLGCENTSEDQQTRNADRFGSGYEIVTNEEPALPDEPPALVGDSLFAHVAYPGGCQDHDFELESDVANDTARVWLRHQGHGDDCEGMIRDRIEMQVPEDVVNAETVLLLNPNADIPFVLRWGEYSGGGR